MPSHSHTSSHPYGPYGPCSYYTRVLYYVAPCKPLRPDPSLPGMDQRGVAQEKWSSRQPRLCLAYGLCLLVLLVIWSVHRPSSMDDVIQDSTWNFPNKDQFWSGHHPSSTDDIIRGSTWNFPDKDHILSVGIHQHADGQNSNHIRHRNALFQPLF